MKLTKAAIGPNNWTPYTWKFVVTSFFQWRLNPRTGFIEDMMPNGKLNVRTTHPSNPNALLAADLIERYGETFLFASQVWCVPAATLVATACNESGGDESAKRFEQHISDYSFGLCQQITSTAYAVGRASSWPRADKVLSKTHPHRDWTMPMMSYPSALKRKLGGHDIAAIREHWARFLGNPYVSIMLAAAVHHFQSKRWNTQHDPILDYATYNSGGLYVGTTRYGLHATMAALEAFNLFYNDTVKIFAKDGDDG